MYNFIRKILFNLDPEQSHYLSLKSLNLLNQLGILKLLFNSPKNNPLNLMGLTFKNRVGLAAGLDKDADYVDALATLGFGFIEIGTVTPKPQIGNPKPRLFRLEKEKAIINRMGFNSKGADYVAEQLAKINYRGILGINLGKNKETPNENAVDDYLIGFRKLAKFASYITINISSPNTAGLRDLQQKDALLNLLHVMKLEQKKFHDEQKKYIPLVVKISPDLSSQELQDIAEILLQEKIDGVIATNTTIDRTNIPNSEFVNEIGGLSGAPLSEKNTNIVRELSRLLQNKIPIIAAGGIMDANDAREKIAAGATLLQIYTGFIYEGPDLIRWCCNV